MCRPHTQSSQTQPCAQTASAPLSTPLFAQSRTQTNNNHMCVRVFVCAVAAAYTDGVRVWPACDNNGDARHAFAPLASLVYATRIVHIHTLRRIVYTIHRTAYISGANKLIFFGMLLRLRSLDDDRLCNYTIYIASIHARVLLLRAYDLWSVQRAPRTQHKLRTHIHVCINISACERAMNLCRGA